MRTSSIESDEAWRILDNHHERQEFEHQLIDRKTTWLLATQAILFAAYGVSLSEDVSTDLADEFRSAVASTAIVLSALTVVGVCAVVGSKILSWRKYRTFFGDRPPGPYTGTRLPWGSNTWITVLSLVPDVFLPVAFIVAWSSLR